MDLITKAALDRLAEAKNTLQFATDELDRTVVEFFAHRADSADFKRAINLHLEAAAAFHKAVAAVAARAWKRNACDVCPDRDECRHDDEQITGERVEEIAIIVGIPSVSYTCPVADCGQCSVRVRCDKPAARAWAKRHTDGDYRP